MIIRHGMERLAVNAPPPVRSYARFTDDFFGSLVSNFAVTAGGTNSNGAAAASTMPAGSNTHTVTAVGDDARHLMSNGPGSMWFGTNIAWVFETNLLIPTLSDGVNNLVHRSGWGDSVSAADHVDGVYLEQDFGTYGDQRWRLCASANSVRTKVDTGIAPVAGTKQKLEIFVSADGATVTCRIDGVTPAVGVTTNIPTFQTRATNITQNTSKALGAGALAVAMDYYDVIGTVSPTR